MQPLYQIKAIRQLESAMIEQYDCTELDLMEQAGKAAFAALQQRWPRAASITVCCGKGNNAGDGLVVARLAQQAGVAVEVVMLFSKDQLSPAAQHQVRACLSAGIMFARFDPDLLIQPDVIIDAILGIGLNGEVKEPYAALIAAINHSDSPVMSLDIPSGIDADTGTVLGCAVVSKLTVTFIALKQGLYTAQAAAHAGEIILADLSINPHLIIKSEPTARLLDWTSLSCYLPKRRRDVHKGDHGRVLVIGGDYGMGGAVRMAAEAAFRAGAGLVTVATRPEHLNVVCGARPEIMCHQVASAEDLEPLIAAATVIVVGPGLGQTEWAEQLLKAVFNSSLPKVVDADALNLLSKSPAYSDDWILTPHPGEASRLLDMPCQHLQKNRFNSVIRLQQRYGGVVVLKGSGTLVQAHNTVPLVCPFGNPGMASAGMGDVLSGVLGGLLAQGLDHSIAAQLGVLLHAKAADLAAEEGGERGLLATDLLTYIRTLANPDYD